MLRDGGKAPEGSEVACDVCIVGAGPAGLTLANELLASRVRVVLLDSGGRDRPRESGQREEIEFSSPHFVSPQQTRRRQLGGMAAGWDAPLPRRGLGARLLPLDPIDFEARSWVPRSGWPFKFDELAPFYERARMLCGLGPLAPPDDLASDAFDELPFVGRTILTGLDQFAPRELVTRTLVDRVIRSSAVTVFENATVTRLRTSDGVTVTTASVRSPRGTSFSVRAPVFVLAGGAIENARLLLLSNEVRPAGLGNEHDNVGRYYMDHPYVIAGFFTPGDPQLFNRVGLYDVGRRHGALLAGRLRVSEATMRRDRLLNSGMSLQPRPNESFAAATRSFGVLRRAAMLREPAVAIPANVAAVVRATPSLVSTAVGLAWHQRRLRPALRYGGWSQLRDNHRRFGYFAVILQPEQVPDPENRVTLGERRDALGQPVPRLRWRWSELDLASISGVRDLLGLEIQRAGLGELERGGPKLALELERAGLAPAMPELDGEGLPALLMPEGAHHHLGTTRMHRDPAQGVVDENCRVHGVANVFVAGGSVFPTSGFANPTLTIVALAIRLADHIAALAAAVNGTVGFVPGTAAPNFTSTPPDRER